MTARATTTLWMTLQLLSATAATQAAALPAHSARSSSTLAAVRDTGFVRNPQGQFDAARFDTLTANALRLLFNHESALHDGPIETVDVRFSPQLFGMTYLEMFAEIADRAAQKGLLVMLACHRLNPTAWPGGGKWYVDSAPDSAILSSDLDAILNQRDPVGRMIAADCLG